MSLMRQERIKIFRHELYMTTKKKAEPNCRHEEVFQSACERIFEQKNIKLQIFDRLCNLNLKLLV